MIRKLKVYSITYLVHFVPIDFDVMTIPQLNTISRIKLTYRSTINFIIKHFPVSRFFQVNSKKRFVYSNVLNYKITTFTHSYPSIVCKVASSYISDFKDRKSTRLNSS